MPLTQSCGHNPHVRKNKHSQPIDHSESELLISTQVLLPRPPRVGEERTTITYMRTKNFFLVMLIWLTGALGAKATEKIVIPISTNETDKAEFECESTAAGTLIEKFYPVKPEILYLAAAYHDLGLSEGREFHHLASGRKIREDKRLGQWFSAEEIELAAQAAEDHRASGKNPPRRLYSISTTEPRTTERKSGISKRSER